MQGKSLSLICGALKWLLDSEEREKAEAEQLLSGKLASASQAVAADGRMPTATAPTTSTGTGPVAPATERDDGEWPGTHSLSHAHTRDHRALVCWLS